MTSPGGVNLATAYVTIVPSAQGIQGNVAQIFAPAESEADEAGKRAGSGFASSAAKWLVSGAAIAAVGAGLKQLFDVGSVFDDMSDTIRIGTGKSGAALAGLEATAKAVATSVPTSFGEASEIVAGLSQRMGLSGDTLTEVAKQYAQAGNLIGGAVDLKGTTAAFNAFGLKGDQVSKAMNQLFQVSQATGVGFNELAAAAQAQAPALKTLGFNFDQTTALIGNLDKAGLNSTAVIASMGKGLVQLAKDGEEPQQAFDRVTGKIGDLVKAGDTAAALDLASTLFGTKGANQFVAAVQSGALGAADLGKAVGQTGDTIIGVADDTADFAESWTVFKNKVIGAVEPAGAAVFNFASKKMGALTASFDVLVPKAKAAWDVLKTGDFAGSSAGMGEEDSPLVGGLLAAHDAAQLAKDQVGKFLNGVIPPLREIGGTLGKAFVGVWETLKPAVAGLAPILPTLLSAFNPIGMVFKALMPVLPVIADVIGRIAGVLASGLAGALTAVQPLLETLAGALGTIMGAFGKLVESLLPPLMGLFDSLVPLIQGVVDVFVPLVGQIADFLIPIIESLLPVVQRVFEEVGNIIRGVVTVVQGVIDIITGIFTGDWSKIWDGIKGLFTGVIDIIKGLFSAFLELGGWLIGVIWDGIKAGATALWDWFTSIPGWIGDKLAAVGGAIVALGGNIIGWIVEGLGDAVKGVFNFAKWIGDKISDALEAVKEWGVQLAKSIWEGIKSFFNRQADFTVPVKLDAKTIITGGPTPQNITTSNPGGYVPIFGGQGRKDGGLLPGYAPGVDVIPAWLSPGEGIMVPELARQVGANRLNAWNKSARSGVQVFADGGTVGWPMSPVVVPVATSAAAGVSVDLSPLASRLDALITLLQEPRNNYFDIRTTDGRSVVEELQEWAAIHGGGSPVG